MPQIAQARRSFAPLVVGFLLAGVALASALWLTARQDASVALVKHTLIVENRLAQVLSALQDAETGQRGYLLTGVGSFLQPYEDGRRAVGPALASVAQLTVDNPQQQKRIGDLQRVANAKFDELDAVMGRYDQGDKAGAIAQVRSGKGKRLMDDARRIVAGDERGKDRRDPEDRPGRQLRAALRSGVARISGGEAAPCGGACGP